MATDGESRKYIKWNAPGIEEIQPGEQAKIIEVAETFNRLQLSSFNDHHHCLRGTHLKTQGCVVGKLNIPELPPHLAQGMFWRPGGYDVIMRYSSLTPKLLPDNISAPRGIAFKVFGVHGEKIWGEDKGTQDFTMNNAPVLELRNPVATYEYANSLEQNWNDIPKFVDYCDKRVDRDLAMGQFNLPRQHMYAMPQYSQSAYRHGDYVVKYGVFPLGEEQKKRADKLITDDDPINVVSQELRDFHMNNKVTYSFCAQLLENIDEQPVEDIGVEWDQKKYPFQQIGTLEFDPQDSWLPEFRTWWDDRITCNGWHGLKEHQPLGSTNRMRRVVYAESRKLRLRVNGYKNYIEPAGLEEVPAPIAAPQIKLPHMNVKTSQEVAA